MAIDPGDASPTMHGPDIVGQGRGGSLVGGTDMFDALQLEA